MAHKISSLLRTIVASQHQWKVIIFQNIPEILGKKLSAKATIAKVTDNTVVIEVTHPGWAQEINLLSQTIKIKINALLKEERIEHIRVQVAYTKPPIARKKSHTIISQESLQKTVPLLCLNHKEDRALHKISNKELRSLLASFYMQCKKTH